jgi:hypothetical protein
MPMDLPSFLPIPSTAADPFGERAACVPGLERTLLGGRFCFGSDSEALLRLAESAYGGLPQCHVPTAAEFRIELRLLPPCAGGAHGPPPVRQLSGAGLLCGVMDGSNYAMLDPQGGRALVSASQDRLADHAYHVRYELIEFAVFTLATRRIGLVPLHGACVGSNGRGVLLLGCSGAGKSTLALHSLLGGLEFLAEDAVFVQPDSLLAHGVPNYLHLCADAPARVADRAAREWLQRSPRIRRRSGVEKIEADLRRGPGRLAAAPMELAGAVLVSREHAGAGAPLLRPLAPAEAIARLEADQPYASGQPGWHRFVRALVPRSVHELRRGEHPGASVDALRRLLG